MNQILFEEIAKLNTPSGPTAFEDAAAIAAADLLRPYVDEVTIDRDQNVIGVKRCGKPDAKRILLDAHLDEVGMIVSGYEDGFLRFFQLGGIDPRVLPNRMVTILTQPAITGIVTEAGPTLDEDKAVPLTELRIDVGMSDEEARQVIPLGTPISFAEGCYPLGEKAVAGKSMDDRSCFVVLVEAMKCLKAEHQDVDIYVLGSAREETDSTGAINAAYRIHPDYAVAVDVTFGNTVDESDSGFDLGCGPVLGCGPNIANWMFQRMKEKCEKLNLSYEVEVMAGSTGTNGTDIQTSREGVATAVLSIPLKYMHTPLEVIDPEDITKTAALLAAFVENIGEEAPELW